MPSPKPDAHPEHPTTHSPLTPYERVKAFVVSDVHLNNHPYDRQREMENPRRRNFRLFLSRLHQEVQDTDKVLLIFNGDMLDITGSWFDATMPWDDDAEQVSHIVNRLVLEILENNLAAFQEIRQFLQHPHTELVYVFGNHDGLLQQFPGSQAVFRAFLSPRQEVRDKVRFVPHFECEELDLYVEHGHLLDPFNHTAGNQPALGDVINILLVNRFVELVVKRLGVNGYSEGFIAKMHARLHDIEYLRPLSLLPVWIQSIATQHESHPENAGKRESVKEIITTVMEEILRDPKMMGYMTRQLRLPRSLLAFATTLMLRTPAVLPLISFITTKLVRRTHSNLYQYKMAGKINREKGVRLLAYGHTHIPGVMPLSESAYYFNTGSWKPVINLFKDAKDLVQLEALNPDAQFNKVERSGILRLERADLRRKTPTEFSLQTVQNGLCQ